MRQICLVLILMLTVHGMMGQTEKSIGELQGLMPGSPAPLFHAIDADSTAFSLEDAIGKGPVVLVFYRGFWCPYCNRHLEKLQDSLSLITGMGASVIAVSPEKPDYLNKMVQKTGAEFTLLYDEGYLIENAYGLGFIPAKAQLFTYNVLLGAKLKETHSDGSQQLPIPATYIIDRNGRIAWRHFDPNYKKRSTVKDILEALGDIPDR